MDNKKKHGVVLGITIVVIALIIWWVATAIMNNSSSNSTKKPTTTQSSQTQSNNNNTSKKPVASNTNTSKEESTSKHNKDAETNNNNNNNNVSEGSGVYQLIDQNSLGVANEKQEIVVVANKKLLLMDSQVGGSGEKQLQYVADVLTTNSDKLSLFLNESAYNSISVGSKLLVTYKVYTNDVGVEFPVVVDAQVTE